MTIERIKVIYKGEERKLYPADLGWERLPESVDELKAAVERHLELAQGRSETILQVNLRAAGSSHPRRSSAKLNPSQSSLFVSYLSSHHRIIETR